jgi:Zinc knuckle
LIKNNSSLIKSPEWDERVKRARNRLSSARETLKKIKLKAEERKSEQEDQDEEQEEHEEQEENSMSAFSYDSAVKLPELKTLGSEEARDFINAVDGYHSILNAEAKTVLIRFLCRTKITGKAKMRLGEQEVATLEELRTKANIEIAKTANATVAVKQAVRGIYHNMGLSAFNRGVESSVRPSVIASRSKTLEEALHVAVTAKAAETTTTAKQEPFLLAGTDGCHNCGKQGHWARECWNAGPSRGSDQR